MPHDARPPAALLTGGMSELAPRGGPTAFLADPRSPALARRGRLRSLLTAIRFCILLFQLAIPCASFLAASPFDVRKYTRHRDNAVTFLV